jgi:hypothetical protein
MELIYIMTHVNINARTWCCEDLRDACEQYLNCDLKGEKHDAFDCVYTLVHRSNEDIYGLVFHDPDHPGGITPIQFCPFCGRKLAP